MSANSLKNNLDADFAFAQELALAAGRILRQFSPDELNVFHKGEINIVTAADQASEDYLRSRLAAERRDDAILGEEGGQSGESERVWVLDPLDGTTNYAHGYPAWCVTVALCISGVTELGAVYDPTRDELFCGRKKHGAFLNGRHLKVSQVSALNKAFIATGFPYNLRERPREVLRPFVTMTRRALGVRRPGSAALDLCYLAAGRFDGFWEYGLYPWDTAAAALIVEEAGGKASDPEGNAWSAEQKFILASNGLIHEEMRKTLQLAKDEEL